MMAFAFLPTLAPVREDGRGGAVLMVSKKPHRQAFIIFGDSHTAGFILLQGWPVSDSQAASICGL